VFHCIYRDYNGSSSLISDGQFELQNFQSKLLMFDEDIANSEADFSQESLTLMKDLLL